MFLNKITIQNGLYEVEDINKKERKQLILFQILSLNAGIKIGGLILCVMGVCLLIIGIADFINNSDLSIIESLPICGLIILSIYLASRTKPLTKMNKCKQYVKIYNNEITLISEDCKEEVIYDLNRNIEYYKKIFLFKDIIIIPLESNKRPVHRYILKAITIPKRCFEYVVSNNAIYDKINNNEEERKNKINNFDSEIVCIEDLSNYNAEMRKLKYLAIGAFIPFCIAFIMFKVSIEINNNAFLIISFISFSITIILLMILCYKALVNVREKRKTIEVGKNGIKIIYTDGKNQLIQWKNVTKVKENIKGMKIEYKQENYVDTTLPKNIKIYKRDISNQEYENIKKIIINA